jgi:hypothetical protein
MLGAGAVIERRVRFIEKGLLPKRLPGRQSAETEAAYQRRLAKFCQLILQIKSSINFEVSSRGWCYLLEQHGLRKGDFDRAQKLIGDCRKDGSLPLDICAEDETREVSANGRAGRHGAAIADGA